MRAAPNSETEVLKRVKGMHVALASGPLFFIKIKIGPGCYSDLVTEPNLAM